MIKDLFCYLLLMANSAFTYGQLVIIQSEQQSIAGNVNSQYFEENPVLNTAGDKLYFSVSKNPGNSGGVADLGDILVASKSNTGWTSPIPLESTINNSNTNKVIGFFNDDRAMLLTGHYPESATTDGFSISYMENEVWQEPVNVSIPYFKRKSEYLSASVSPDGQVIIFSMMTFGSYGVEDLYFSRLKPNGKWSDLRSLGPTINSKYQELTPFISPDNKTLYFASNGKGGEGGLDIFSSERLDDTWKSWSEPQNLGPMVNTPGAETSFSFLPGSDFAVFVSTQNSDGYGDIRMVDITFPEDFVAETPNEEDHPLLDININVEPETPVEVTPGSRLSGSIYNKNNGTPISGEIIWSKDEETGSLNAESDGFVIELSDTGRYKLIVKASDFLEYDTTFVLASHQQMRRDFYLYPLEVGSTIQLNHVLFERATTNFLDGSEQDLEAVFHMMRDNPTVEIEVTGHTDNRGNFKLNVKLSQERVDKVIAYLMEKGINKKRMSGKGWGPMKPIASNGNEESRRLNRRVEFTITKK